MKTKLIVFSACVILASSAPVASAKGCIKGAVVGGVAGHVVGHHGLVGAAGGCLIGRHRANKQAKENAKQQAQATAVAKKSPPSQRVPATQSGQ